MSEGNVSDAGSSRGSPDEDFGSDSHSRSGSLNSDLVFPELVTISRQFEDFQAVISEQLHSLSDKLEAFHTNALHDRARIVALERTSVHTRQLVDLVAQHNEDRAHIEALEKTIKALKSEFKFIRRGPIPFAIAQTTPLADIPQSASSSRTLVESDIDHSDVEVTPKGKGKQRQRQRSLERSSKSASGRPSRSSVAKLKEGETESATRSSVQASPGIERLRSAKGPATLSSRSSSPTIKPAQKRTVKSETKTAKEITPREPPPAVKRERTSSWVELHGTSASATSPATLVDSQVASTSSSTQPRQESTSRAEPSRDIAMVSDEDQLARLSALLDLENPLRAHTSASLPHTVLETEPEVGQAEEEPPPSGSDSDSSDENFQDAVDPVYDEAVNAEDLVYHYAGVNAPPRASPVAIGPLSISNVAKILKIPNEIPIKVRNMIASKEPQLHVAFHKDIVLLYNPFALESQAGPEPDPPDAELTSVITGWGTPEKMLDIGEYIEQHIPQEGKVFHTLALYKTKKKWWYLGALKWEVSLFRTDWSQILEEEKMRICDQLSSSWNRGMKAEEIQQALDSEQFDQYCIKLSRGPDAKDISLDFATTRLHHIHAGRPNLWY